MYVCQKVRSLFLIQKHFKILTILKHKIGYLFANFLFEEKIMPPWVKEAQSFSYIKETGTSLQAALSDLLPEDFKLPGSGGGENQGGEAPVDGTEEPPPEATTGQSG